MKTFYILILLKLLLLAVSKPILSDSETTMTNWKIEPSIKYDACCFLNILTGDEFYLDYYRQDYENYKSRITPDAKTALDSLSKKLKHDNGKIISAWLCLYFSAADDKTLADMIKTVDDPRELKENFSKSQYYDDEDWKIFESVQTELKDIFGFLISSGFEKYWEDSIKTKIDKRINELKPDLPKYDVIRENEKMLGFKLPSDTIQVYMLYFVMPHGIKITGMRFLTAPQWPFEILVRTAAHEMMHPPYDYKNDAEIRELLKSFEADEFFMDKVKNHNPSFGYNTPEGLFEEDCVQSLDQVINESLGVSIDARKRWQQSDDGIHVLAVALYQIMKEENYNSGNEVFRDFLLRIFKEGKLTAGMVKDYYNKFYP